MSALRALLVHLRRAARQKQQTTARPGETCRRALTGALRGQRGHALAVGQHGLDAKPLQEDLRGSAASALRGCSVAAAARCAPPARPRRSPCGPPALRGHSQRCCCARGRRPGVAPEKLRSAPHMPHTTACFANATSISVPQRAQNSAPLLSASRAAIATSVRARPERLSAALATRPCSCSSGSSGARVRCRRFAELNSAVRARAQRQEGRRLAAAPYGRIRFRGRHRLTTHAPPGSRWRDGRVPLRPWAAGARSRRALGARHPPLGRQRRRARRPMSLPWTALFAFTLMASTTCSTRVTCGSCSSARPCASRPPALMARRDAETLGSAPRGLARSRCSSARPLCQRRRRTRPAATLRTRFLPRCARVSCCAEADASRLDALPRRAAFPTHTSLWAS